MLDLESLNPVLEFVEPAKIVAWAAHHFEGDLVMSSSFGAESAVLLRLATEFAPQIRVIFVDTGFLFDETREFMHALRRRFDLNVLIYRPLVPAKEYLATVGEPDANWRIDIDGCCAANKNEPFDRAMRENFARAWLRGIRRDQADTRRERRVIEFSKRLNCYAISPLLNWDANQVRAYMKEHDLPYHPLFESGYTSIGCCPLSCTRPIQIGESQRAGRWSGGEKTECGLHL